MFCKEIVEIEAKRTNQRGNQSFGVNIETKLKSRAYCFGWLCQLRVAILPVELFAGRHSAGGTYASWTFANLEGYRPRHVLWTGESACSNINLVTFILQQHVAPKSWKFSLNNIVNTKCKLKLLLSLKSIFTAGRNSHAVNLEGGDTGALCIQSFLLFVSCLCTWCYKRWFLLR